MGRVARGVRGIRLGTDDEVVSMDILDPEKDVLTVTLNGFGKRSATDRYRTTRRGGKGIMTILTTERNGLVVGSIQVGDDDQVLLVTDGATMIRFKASEMRTLGRYTQGVRLVRLKKGELVVAIERLMDVDDDEGLATIDGEMLDDGDSAAAEAEDAESAADDDGDDAADDDGDDAADDAADDDADDDAAADEGDVGAHDE
jgi:DNA gyrase subunit A